MEKAAGVLLRVVEAGLSREADMDFRDLKANATEALRVAATLFLV